MQLLVFYFLEALFVAVTRRSLVVTPTSTLLMYASSIFSGKIELLTLFSLKPHFYYWFTIWCVYTLSLTKLNFFTKKPYTYLFCDAENVAWTSQEWACSWSHRQLPREMWWFIGKIQRCWRFHSTKGVNGKCIRYIMHRQCKDSIESRLLKWTSF